MNFNKHSTLVGLHAFLSPSKGSWTNYDEDKLERVFATNLASERGTKLHDLAQQLISLGIKLPENGTTLSLYVNDAIGFRMTPEQPLFFSMNCYGTTDAISFRNNTLRIHDLKTGAIVTSFKQLEIYAALFCHEYRFKPFELEMILRIYQNDEFRELVADPDDIFHLMEKIKYFDKLLTTWREEAP